MAEVLLMGDMVESWPFKADKNLCESRDREQGGCSQINTYVSTDCSCLYNPLSMFWYIYPVHEEITMNHTVLF